MRGGAGRKAEGIEAAGLREDSSGSAGFADSAASPPLHRPCLQTDEAGAPGPVHVVEKPTTSGSRGAGPGPRGRKTDHIRLKCAGPRPCGRKTDHIRLKGAGPGPCGRKTDHIRPKEPQKRSSNRYPISKAAGRPLFPAAAKGLAIELVLRFEDTSWPKKGQAASRAACPKSVTSPNTVPRCAGSAPAPATCPRGRHR